VRKPEPDEPEASLKVSFELSPRDVRYFRERLQRVRKGQKARDEGTVIELTRTLIEEARDAKPPEFVLERLTTLELLTEVLEDEEWRIEGRDRARILDAVAYFVDPDDLIPDRVPGIGYLDDAIMVELVASELTHDIKAYEDFCEYRKANRPQEKAEEKLARRRENLISRMRRRRRAERATKRSRPRSTRSPDRLW
jgi:uncharacterized membrane protein YkvA (DUF1232 family)